jgi:DNA-binding transcriptional regulator GbsR (MarR family)
MPFENLVVLLIGIAFLIILLAVVIIITVRKLGISSLGPIKIEQRNLSTEHKMNEETREADDICLKQIRQATNNMKLSISNVFAELKICTIARVAISSIIRFPLYESVANNHFTTELMPENFKEYRERLIRMTKEEYISLSAVSKEIQCNKEPLPTWDQISQQLIERIDHWIKSISREVMITCKKKIAIYQTYLPSFIEMKDEWRTDIVKKCIEKNERYIAVLKERAGIA